MTVITADDDMHHGGLQLCDADGKLTQENIPGVEVATWFPDSKRLLVSRMVNVKTWDELTRWLTPEEASSVAATGQHVREDADRKHRLQRRKT